MGTLPCSLSKCVTSVDPSEPDLTWAWIPIGVWQTILAGNPSRFSQSPVSPVPNESPVGSSRSNQTVHLYPSRSQVCSAWKHINDRIHQVDDKHEFYLFRTAKSDFEIGTVFTIGLIIIIAPESIGHINLCDRCGARSSSTGIDWEGIGARLFQTVVANGFIITTLCWIITIQPASPFVARFIAFRLSNLELIFVKWQECQEKRLPVGSKI